VAQTLLHNGWTNVRPLLGGFDAWVKGGMPTESKPTRRQSPREVASNIEAAEGEGDK
jgi:3-mercaptopyruvate sulfurtransferase SseA